MSKKKIIRYTVVLILVSILLSACASKEKRYEQHFYAETQEYIRNPYQGPYFQFYTKEPERLKEDAEKYQDCTMVLVSFNLDDEYKMEIIPEEKLNDLRQTLIEAEQIGLSVIIRAAYDFSGEVLDPEFPVLLGHIEQIAEVINENKTCVAGVQAGMIGAFGEWTKSRYMEEKRYRLEVIEKWLQVLDEDIPVSVRRQKFIREAQESGIDISRLGIYNDGMFASESDLGTYREDYNRAEDLEWSESTLKVPFNGGEMPCVSEYAHVDNVIKEASCLNLSYLHRHYHEDVWKLWEEEYVSDMAGDEYIKKYLGSRIWVESLSISEEYYKQKEMEITVNIKNSGFAMVDPFYEANVIYTHNGKSISRKTKLDMKSKTEGSFCVVLQNPFYKEEVESVTVEVKISRPECMDSDYCIRLANENVPYINGRNILILYEGEGE